MQSYETSATQVLGPACKRLHCIEICTQEGSSFHQAAAQTPLNSQTQRFCAFY